MKDTTATVKGGSMETSPSRLIDARIEEMADWRGEKLGRIRALIKEADPEVVEEVKWRKPSNPLGVPYGSTLELSAPVRLTRTR